MSRHFPDGLSLEPIQAWNGPQFNNAPPRSQRGMNSRRFLPRFPCLGSRDRNSARNRRCAGSSRGHLADFPCVPPMSVCTRLLRRSCTHEYRRWQRQSRDTIQNRGKQASRHRHLGQLKGHVLGVSRHLGTDLDELFPQRCQRPVSHWFRQGQSPQEVAQVVGQRELVTMKPTRGNNSPACHSILATTRRARCHDFA